MTTDLHGPVHRARKIRLIVLDVDGVLTDGGLYYDSEGRVTKRFNAQDGLGIKTAQAAGVDIAVISGLDSLSVKKRVAELGITEYFAGARHKIPHIEDICSRHGITLEEVAYIGDDWVDLGPMRVVGLPIAVANAQPEVKERAAFVTRARGGDGAVREAIRFILDAQGKLEAQLARWDHP